MENFDKILFDNGTESITAANGVITFNDANGQTVTTTIGTATQYVTTAPTSHTYTGIVGQIAASSSAAYICYATNSWLKITGATTSF